MYFYKTTAGQTQLTARPWAERGSCSARRVDLEPILVLTSSSSSLFVMECGGHEYNKHEKLEELLDFYKKAAADYDKVYIYFKLNNKGFFFHIV